MHFYKVQKTAGVIINITLFVCFLFKTYCQFNFKLQDLTVQIFYSNCVNDCLVKLALETF